MIPAEVPSVVEHFLSLPFHPFFLTAACIRKHTVKSNFPTQSQPFACLLQTVWILLFLARVKQKKNESHLISLS